MKDDILKFRKLCNILIEEKGMTVNKICIESGITWPTMKKLRENEINDIHIMSSVLGQIQNYIHKHCDTINYAGIKSETFVEKTEKELSDQMKREQTNAILAEKRKAEFDEENKKIKPEKRDLGPVKESESSSLAGAKVHERLDKEITGKRKYSPRQKKDEKGFVVSSELKAEDLFKKKESDIAKPGKIVEEVQTERDLHIPTTQELLDEVPFWKLVASIHRRLPEGLTINIEITKKS